MQLAQRVDGLVKATSEASEDDDIKLYGMCVGSKAIEARTGKVGGIPHCLQPFLFAQLRQ